MNMFLYNLTQGGAKQLPQHTGRREYSIDSLLRLGAIVIQGVVPSKGFIFHIVKDGTLGFVEFEHPQDKIEELQKQINNIHEAWEDGDPKTLRRAISAAHETSSK